MRELKFRAWDERNLIMHYDFNFIKSGEETDDWIVFKSDKQPLNEEKVFDNPYFSGQLKIMQYIGEKDANGKEIYEGDIGGTATHCITTQLNEKGEIIEHYEDYASEEDDTIITWEHINNINGDLFVVSGNIYENPELLLEKNNENTWCLR